MGINQTDRQTGRREAMNWPLRGSLRRTSDKGEREEIEEEEKEG